MKLAYASLSLLIIISALRAPTVAQQPATRSRIIPRQSFMTEALRRRLPPPATETPIETLEEPVLRIETVALRLPDLNAGLGQSKPWLTSLSGVYETALFQRQRFRETGQPIEFERGRLYFRQDRYVATKGLVLYRLWNERIDFGLYKRRYHGEASPVRGQTLFLGQGDRSYLFSGGRQIFFGVRFNLGKNPQRKR